MFVTSLQSWPRRIYAVSNKMLMSTLAHHASVIPTASRIVPATTGYRGKSDHLGDSLVVVMNRDFYFRAWAASSARTSAFDLLTLSSYSPIGVESATMPPPA